MGSNVCFYREDEQMGHAAMLYPKDKTHFYEMAELIKSYSPVLHDVNHLS